MTEAVAVSTYIGLGAFTAIMLVGILVGLIVTKVDVLVAKEDH